MEVTAWISNDVNKEFIGKNFWVNTRGGILFLGVHSFFTSCSTIFINNESEYRWEILLSKIELVLMWGNVNIDLRPFPPSGCKRLVQCPRRDTRFETFLNVLKKMFYSLKNGRKSIKNTFSKTFLKDSLEIYSRWLRACTHDYYRCCSAMRCAWLLKIRNINTRETDRISGIFWFASSKSTRAEIFRA